MSTGADEVEVRHEPERSRWAAYVGGSEAGYADYLIAEDPPRIVFPHTVTHPAYGGRGVASRVVSAALAHVQEEGGRQVVPQCWFVAEHIAKHPELAGLLEPVVAPSQDT